jgi:hypothetical protein
LVEMLRWIRRIVYQYDLVLHRPAEDAIEGRLAELSDCW